MTTDNTAADTTTIIAVWPDHGSGERQPDGSPRWIVSRDTVEPGSDDALTTDTLAVLDSRDAALARAREIAGSTPIRVWRDDQSRYVDA